MASEKDKKNGSSGVRTSDVNSPIDEAVAMVLLREAYTKERHYMLMRTIIVLGICLIVSIVLNIALSLRTPENKYFATDTDGRMTVLTALDTPIQNRAELLNWTANAVTESFTLSFHQYQKELQNISKYFTVPDGWKQFQNALETSGMLKSIINGKYVTQAVVRAAPVIKAEGIVNGAYNWKMDVPIKYTSLRGNESASVDMIVEVTVQRVKETNNPKGLAIKQIVVITK